uniref:ABM domain-containing protein n=1 Tax=Fibrocapsa japonica TaxID=94617 RepID=A0A7S2UUI6_9STRA|mmetsp:Transcript_10298/g.15502  ORF Transcript_10298/g.15502 Transcript_10298/m.15502 type:complete len:237 (+) Transcript_10298:79-789(+)
MKLFTVYHHFFLFAQCCWTASLCAALAHTSNRSMIRGVGVLRTMVGKDGDASNAITKHIQDHVAATSSLSEGKPVRATMVTTGNKVVFVQEWNTITDHQVYSEQIGNDLDNCVQTLVQDPPTCEFFPEALHIFQGSSSDDIGILVRQSTSSSENGAKLRDVQKAAYERQMGFEPGCTCCIILANGSDTVRIIELWKTMQDFSFHESSEWHAQGEEHVVPLVTDMDCDFVKGSRLLF